MVSTNVLKNLRCIVSFKPVDLRSLWFNFGILYGTSLDFEQTASIDIEFSHSHMIISIFQLQNVFDGTIFRQVIPIYFIVQDLGTSHFGLKQFEQFLSSLRGQLHIDGGATDTRHGSIYGN